MHCNRTGGPCILPKCLQFTSTQGFSYLNRTVEFGYSIHHTVAVLLYSLTASHSSQLQLLPAWRTPCSCCLWSTPAVGNIFLDYFGFNLVTLCHDFASLLNLCSNYMLRAGFLQIRGSVGTGRSVSVGLYLNTEWFSWDESLSCTWSGGLWDSRSHSGRPIIDHTKKEN